MMTDRYGNPDITTSGLAVFTAAGGAVTFILSATLVGGSTVSIFSSDSPFAFRIIDAWSVAKSADGGAWVVDDGSNTIISTVTVTGTDKIINRAADIDDAYHSIAAGGSLRALGFAVDADAIVYVKCMRE